MIILMERLDVRTNDENNNADFFACTYAYYGIELYE